MERVSLVYKNPKQKNLVKAVGEGSRDGVYPLVLSIPFGFLISSEMTRNERMNSILKCCNTEFESERTYIVTIRNYCTYHTCIYFMEGNYARITRRTTENNVEIRH